MKLSWTVAATLVFIQVFGGVTLPLPNVTKNPIAIATPKAPPTHPHRTTLLPSPPPLAQQPQEPPNSLGQELLQELVLCIRDQLPNLQHPSMDALETASMQCVFQVVMLGPDGAIRPDANERLTVLFQVTGISFPQPSRQGQASVQLQPLPDSSAFTIPVTIGGESRMFLLDTGASNSIVDSQIAQQLGLEGTPVPQDLLQYMVVGDNCSEVEAKLHPLPVLRVDEASVEGLNGMGLPKTAIIGNLSGVLGLDFLSGFDMIVNPKTLQLQLLSPSSPSADAIPLKGRLGVMTAQVQINGQGPFTFLLDTGADVMVLSEQLATQLSLNIAEAEEIEVLGFCGTEVSKKTTLAQVQLQQHQATNLDAVILSPGVLDLLGVDGIIGQNFLNQYRQHWRFGELNELGFPENGSLVLSPY